QVGLAAGKDRKLQRKAPRLVDAPLHMLGDLAEVVVAGGELGPGVADADDRPAVEEMVRETLVAHPASVQEGVLDALAVEPGLAAQFLFAHRALSLLRDDAAGDPTSLACLMMMSSMA